MKQLLLVFLGGGAGSMLRYSIMRYMNTSHHSIPFGTLTVNVLGSFVIGVLLGALIKNDPTSGNMSLLLVAGFCGGFTTFSAFAYENYELLKNGEFLNFALYTGGSLILGVLAVLLGIWLSRSLI
jgi:CrcB protein